MIRKLRMDAHRIGKIALVAALGVSAGACVQLSAPEKPIEINLNINIRQEVLVRLEKDVQELVDKNPGVF